MASVIIYNPDGIPKKVLRYLRSVNTPDYSSRPDVIVNPVLPSGVLKYWKVVDSSVVEFTQEEKDAQDAAELAVIAQAEQDRMRTKGPIYIDNRSVEPAVLRAVILELLDYINNYKSDFNNLLQWLGSQTTLSNRVQLSEGEQTLATPAQARTAIKDRIAAGEADD